MSIEPSPELVSAGMSVAAPMSFAGSAQRIWPLTRRGHNGWQSAGLVTAAILLITIVWALVLAWYATWGIWLIPYRLVRRGQRKQKLAEVRHVEMMNRMIP
jgi:uncharacterized membrane-anchored protein